jgi:hypothetical protein
MPKNKLFQFLFSLEVLNHLGRGLYRSFATVVAEAVSNSWDAEAKEVNITITDDSLIVEDDGKGMDASDFREKFLTVGYSRREDKTNKSKRSVIGRKGIGKLAMLSVSEKVTIITKKKDSDVTGGTVNNTNLDKEIKSKGKYKLDELSNDEKNSIFTKDTGTKIIFQKIKTKLNREEIIRKYIATQFNFIFSLKGNDTFSILVNGTKVTEDDLKELNDNTQFIWFLNEKDTRFSDKFKNLDREKVIPNTEFTFRDEKISIRGFIASVKASNQLLLKGSGGDFQAGINLFTNGRLRQENLFDEITRKTLTEEYLYGEVHVDGFDGGKDDRFTSSREGIIKDDPLYQEFLTELKKIQAVIIQDWTPWRNKLKQEGDIDQDKRPGYEVRMDQSKNRREQDFKDKINQSIGDKDTKKQLQQKLKELSYKNTLVYQDLYILENIFREYIKLKNITETDFDISDDDEKEIVSEFNRIKNLRQQDEERHSLKGKIVKDEHYLNYLHLFHLGDVIDTKISKVKAKKKANRKGLELDTKEILPVRNSVMHTNEITDDVLKWPKIKNVIDYIERLKTEDEEKDSK